jgi:uncharacterized membrane protein (DUF485 family)
MQKQLLYTGAILFLFALLVLGIPLFPDFMATNIFGSINFGMATFLLLNIITPIFAFKYLKQIRKG